MNPFLYFAFDQVQHPLNKVLKQRQPLTRKVVVDRAVQRMERREIVFVLQVDDCDLEKGISRIEFIVKMLGSLLKMQDCVFLFGDLVFDALGKDLSNVEVCLGAGFVLLDDCLEVFQCFLVLLAHEAGKRSLQVTLQHDLASGRVFLMQVLLFDNFNGIRIGFSGLIRLLQGLITVTKAHKSHEVSLLLMQVRLRGLLSLRGRTIQFLRLFVQGVETFEVGESQLEVILDLQVVLGPR